jgi:hypothetical protein
MAHHSVQKRLNDMSGKAILVVEDDKNLTDYSFSPFLTNKDGLSS